MKESKHKFSFEVSARFEPFFALQTLTDPGSRIHEGWKSAALQRLPRSFHKKLASTGGGPFLWPTVADVPGNVPLSMPFEEMISQIAGVPPRDLQQRIFLGVFHDPAVIAPLLSGKGGLPAAIGKASKTKREWLAFIGLYPISKNSPLFMGLEWLLRAPGEFQKNVCEILSTFWDTQFKETWEQLRGKLQQSCEEKERLFQSCSLGEFAQLARLRVEIDERKGLMKAVRGGAVVRLKDLESASILPSAFNDKRHWTGYGSPKELHVYLPYFDPAISLSAIARTGEVQTTEPERDPALIFKALGDTTRYAMAALLARNALTSADLAKTLALSRPTVSHHIHLLREAGLLEEKVQGNAVLLSLKQEAFEDLSELAIQKLFHSDEKVDLKKTRSK